MERGEREGKKSREEKRRRRYEGRATEEAEVGVGKVKTQNRGRRA